MCKVIAIANQKGGVAKSTTAISLGVGLVRKEKKVLIIDNDPQGSCTVALGYQELEKIEITLATIIDRVLNEDEFDLMDGILHNEEGVDLLPANIQLAGVEKSLLGISCSETILQDYVELIESFYDYIIIDCSPNLGQLTINALTCADAVIIPVHAAYLAMKGLEQPLRTISRVKKKLNPKLEIMGILVTMVDARTNYAKDIIQYLLDFYNGKIHIFGYSIPLSVRAAECPASGISIFEHDGNGKVAQAYEKLTEEVLLNE